MGSEGMEYLKHHAVSKSQTGWVEVKNKSCRTCGIMLEGENWCKVLYVRLIITPDGTAKEEVLKEEMLL